MAVRYAFSSPLRYSILRSDRKEAPFITKDLLVQNWINTTPKSLEPEIDSVFWRNQIEEDNLEVDFLEKISELNYRKFTQQDFYD